MSFMLCNILIFFLSLLLLCKQIYSANATLKGAFHFLKVNIHLMFDKVLDQNWFAVLNILEENKSMMF